MMDVIIDALLDTLKLLPYLFVTFLLLEFIEHKLNKKMESTLKKYKKMGPIFGGLIGGFPQCGFSAMASNLYNSKVITMGTLISIFLSTSDEMLPIMLSENVSILLVVKIIGFKIIVGIIVGLLVDLLFKSKIDKNEIKNMCNEEHCHCKNGIFMSSVIHTLKTGLFILIANIIINTLVFMIGIDTLSHLLNGKNIIVYFVASLIGLIPNCVSSIILTEVYISGIVPIGVTLAGLLTGSGIGTLLLFKNNNSLKENFTILGIIYFVGVFVGILVDIFI